MQKISVRLDDETVAEMDNFGAVHKMSRAASVEFFTKLGVREFSKIERQDALNEQTESKFIRIETLLKAMQKSNYRALVYLTTATAKDQTRFDSANQVADKNVQEIFENEREAGHDN